MKEILWIREPEDIAIDRRADIQSLENNENYSLTIVNSIKEAFLRLKIRSNIERPFDAVIVDSWIDDGGDPEWKSILDRFKDKQYVVELVKSLAGRGGSSTPASPQCFVPKNVIVTLGNTQQHIDAFESIDSEICALRFGQVGSVTLRMHFDTLFGFSSWPQSKPRKIVWGFFD